MCPYDTWTMEKVTHGKMNSRVRGSFLSLEGNQTIRWGRGEEKKRENERDKKKRRKTMCGGKEKKKKENGTNSLCFDGRKSIVREIKLVYSMRAMSRCQKKKEVGFSPTLVPLNLRAVNGHVVQPQPWD